MTTQLSLPGTEEKKEPGYIVIERKGHKLCIAPGSLADWVKKGWTQVGVVK